MNNRIVIGESSNNIIEKGNTIFINDGNLKKYEIIREVQTTTNYDYLHKSSNNRPPIKRVFQILETDITDNNSKDFSKCLICDAPSSGFHFNAPSCSACAAYFRRTVTLNRVYVCQQNNNCKVFYALRVICKACRYKKCLEAGMDRNAVQPRRECNFGRRKFAYKTKIIEATDHVEIGSLEGEFHTNKIEETNITEVKNQNHVIPAFNSNLYLTSPNHILEKEKSVFNKESHYFCSQTPIPSVANYHYPFYKPNNNCITNNSFNIQSCSNTTFNQNQNQVDDIIPNNVNNNFNIGSLKNEKLYSVIEDLMEEEKKTRERRRILFCSKSKFEELFKEKDVLITFTSVDIRPMKFSKIRKELRSMVLIIFEWTRSRKFWKYLSVSDQICLLKRTVLHHTILDPAYLTAKIGYPSKFIMSNGMYVSINPDKNNEGWEDEPEINSSMKKSLYISLMNQVIDTLVIPLIDLNITSTELIFLKALVSWKNSGLHVLSSDATYFLEKETEKICKELYKHYQIQGMKEDEISIRMGNIFLLIGNIYTLGMHTIESHVKISFFDLWELDSMILRLFKD
uniref:Mitochondrial import inner membrane translocase subunit TIM17 n=1 Tax=Strongyloides stercoralis TaxID=6248 RepID=A0A0K0EDV1_STRER